MDEHQGLVGALNQFLAVTTTTVNAAADFVVQITGELAVGTDELALESWVIEAVYMP